METRAWTDDVEQSNLRFLYSSQRIFVHINGMVYKVAVKTFVPFLLISAFLGNGVIQVATRIDRDSGTFREHPNVSLVIRVVDSPGDAPRSNETTIVITILDINDNPPVCTQYNFGYEYFNVLSASSSTLDNVILVMLFGFILA